MEHDHTRIIDRPDFIRIDLTKLEPIDDETWGRIKPYLNLSALARAYAAIAVKNGYTIVPIKRETRNIAA
jgi:hypothetical protein